MVAAAAGLLLSQDPTRSRADIYRILTGSADETYYGPGYHPETGWGRLNIYKALTYTGGKVYRTPSGIKIYNWPNPFKASEQNLTNISFYLDAPVEAKLVIRDLSGDLVLEKKLDAAATYQGINIATWDGRNANGRDVANGVYLLTIEAGGRFGSNRIAVLR